MSLSRKLLLYFLWVITLDLVSANLSMDLRIEDNRRLKCSVWCDHGHKESGLARLQLLKNDMNGWSVLAQLNDMAPEEINLGENHSFSDWSGNLNISVHWGMYNQQNLGYLSVTWPPDSDNRYGEYWCKAVRFNPSQNQIETAGEKITIGKDLKPLAILNIMRSNRLEVMAKIESLVNQTAHAGEQLNAMVDTDMSVFVHQLGQLEMDLNSTLRDYDEQMEKIKESVEYSLMSSQQEQDKELAVLRSKLETGLKRGFLMLWPSGKYGLPQPASGCPSSGGDPWKEGWWRHHTESTDRNQDKVSKESHLLKPVLMRHDGQNYIFQRFCAKTSANSPGPLWPKGSYCITKVDKCPSDFSNGYIQWDDEDDSTTPENQGVVPSHTSEHTKTVFRYCCRSDGEPGHPIDLPRSQPFYLYRHGGQCQQVAGMSVTEEFIYFDTENNNNADETGGQHPDVEVNNVRLFLCYYTQ